MKEFNLEEAKAGKPVCTRDGKPARIVCWDRKDKLYPIVALVDEGNWEQSYAYTEEGKFSIATSRYGYDLMMATEKHEGWINLYRSKGNKSYPYQADPGGAIYTTEENARFYGKSSKDYITTIKIEWEE